MTAPARLPGKKTGRGTKPVTLDRVTYRAWVSATWPTDYYKPRKRFTVRVRHMGDYFGECFQYAPWDKKYDGWLYPISNCDRRYRTRAEAWAYLKNTTVMDREYRLEMANQALDGKGAA
jgi:hypothetical protein